MVVPEPLGLLPRPLHHAPRTLGERELDLARPLVAAFEHALDLLTHLIEGDVELGEEPRGDATLPEETQEQVLGVYMAAAEASGFFAGQSDSSVASFRNPRTLQHARRPLRRGSRSVWSSLMFPPCHTRFPAALGARWRQGVEGEV